jgi:hypothetical protein
MPVIAVKKVHIMRGAPGTGKSHFLRERLSHVFICSADHFWGPDYDVDIARLPEARAYCREKFINACTDLTQVAVDNTNIRTWEWYSYALMARALGAEVFVHEFVPRQLADAFACARRNCHNVPPAVVLKMMYDFVPARASRGITVIQHPVVVTCTDED